MNVSRRGIWQQLKVICFAGVASSCAVFGKNTRVYVNQVGYQPQHEKFAIVESDATVPQPWQVRDASGARVASGLSIVRGSDPESGESLHWIRLELGDGSGYQLDVIGETSAPFDVARGIYRELKYDALAYFYYNRSGIPISLPWAKEFRWTHPAGHLSDANASCAGRPCKYVLDAQGGWYDAGDYGKYVVNGGIALWTLFNLYERTKYWGRSLGDFADGKLSIPERGNGVNDLLDEARWELEFLMRMQVPRGHDLEGMVHHKIHDKSWSTLGRTPPEQSDNRALHPPSTAATLNLAAVAAQGARVFSAVDPLFSSLCLRAAVRAWNAAHDHPRLFASPMNNNGGGPYDDNEVSDEFYWAAAELFVTLGEPRLLAYLRGSRHFGKAPEVVQHERSRYHTSMTWQATAALGTISLAVVPNALPADIIDGMRKSVVATAGKYLDLTETSGFRVPMRADSSGHYPWGSNSFVLNNAIVMALAADFTQERRYVEGVADAMDYLLGRNPLGFSYVTGYGERHFDNPHHRFWAHQRCRRCPTPPPGAVAGGPNSRLPDPTSKRLAGCPVLKCYLDHLDAWGVNEVAINWNGPLAWVAAFLDEQLGSSSPIERATTSSSDSALEPSDSKRPGRTQP